MASAISFAVEGFFGSGSQFLQAMPEHLRLVPAQTLPDVVVAQVGVLVVGQVSGRRPLQSGRASGASGSGPRRH